MVEVGVNVIITTIMSGIVLGALHALMALGLALVYATVRVLNFTHGGFFSLGAFLVWWLSAPKFSEYFGVDPKALGLALPFFLAFAIALLIMLGVGALFERGVIRPIIAQRDWEVKILFVTVSLLVAVENFNILAFGPTAKRVFTPIEGFIYLSELPLLSYMEMIQLSIALAALVAMHLFIKYHRNGLAMRAVAQDVEIAGVLGIRISKIYSLTFAISAVLATLSGVMISNIFFVRFDVGTVPMLMAFMIIILGGIGSIPGTIVASFITGEILAFTQLYFGAGWQFSAVFALVALILIFRPQGLFGFKE